MSIRFALIVMIVLVVVVIDGYPLIEALTEGECKAYFASDDINQRLQAMFVCPKKWRPKMKRIESSVAKRSIEDQKKEFSEEELDDFYLFW